MTGSHSDLALSAVQAPGIKRITTKVIGWKNNIDDDSKYHLHNLKCFLAAFALGNSFRFQSSNTAHEMSTIIIIEPFGMCTDRSVSVNLGVVTAARLPPADYTAVKQHPAPASR